MANEQNLKPVRTKKEARERGQRGGKASGEARRKKKTERERYQLLLDLTTKKGDAVELEDVESILDLSKQNLKAGDLIALKTLQKAMRGNLEAVRLIYNILGSLNAPPEVEAEEIEDDGLIEALRGTAAEDWKDEEA